MLRSGAVGAVERAKSSEKWWEQRVKLRSSKAELLMHFRVGSHAAHEF